MTEPIPPNGVLNQHPLVVEHLANQAALEQVLLELDMLGHPAAGVIRGISDRATKAEAECVRLRGLVADEHSRLSQDLEREAELLARAERAEGEVKRLNALMAARRGAPVDVNDVLAIQKAVRKAHRNRGT